jgi:predicted O-methyltransferase YrrM
VSAARRALGAARHRAGRARDLRRLPPGVRRFVLAAEAHARAVGDDFSLLSASRPGNLAMLLALAEGRRTVVELGTATGWTACALALADPAREVVSVDPVVWPHRSEYLDLAGRELLARLEFRRMAGAEAPAIGPMGVDLLFVDSSHDREPTVAEVEAWRPNLAPGALVVLDDIGHPDYPGVAQAAAELGLRGAVRGSLLVCRAPA